MKFYNIFLILTVLVFAGFLYPQPPPEGMDCPEEDCIEKMGDLPPGPPDMDRHQEMMKGRKMEKMSDEKIDKIMQNILSNHPEFHKKLMTVKDKHPKIFMRTIHKLRRFIRNDKKEPGEKADILGIISEEIEIDLLVEKYSFEKEPKKKEEIKAELLKKMSVSFDIREELKLEFIKNIENNLEKKKADFAKRKADKDKIIKDDLERILDHHGKMEKDQSE